MKNLNLCLAVFISTSLNGQWAEVGPAGFSPGVSNDLSLAIDLTGNPVLAFRDGAASGSSSVMRFDGSSWSYVGGAGSASIGASLWQTLAVHPIDGSYYVGQRDGGVFSNSTVYRYDGSSWSLVGLSAFSAGITEYHSLAISSTGTPYIAYKDYGFGGYVTVMKYDGTSWVNVGLPGFSPGIVEYVSLAINPLTDQPYVSFRDYGNGSRATVMAFDGTSWGVVGSAGFSAGIAIYESLAFDGSGTPYLAYRDYGNGSKVTCMTYDGSSWVNLGLAGFSAGISDWISLAITPSGTPFIAYKDFGSGGGTTVSSFDGVSWASVGPVSFSDGNAEQHSLVLDLAETPYVAYKDGAYAGAATVQSFDSGSSCTATTSSFTITECDAYTVPSGDETYLLTGTYMDTIANAGGCDSVMTIDVIINNETTSSITMDACFDYTVPSGDETYFVSGLYNDTISNAAGCDSVITIDLTINTVDVAVTQTGFDLMADASGATYQWVDCDAGFSILAGETNQSFSATNDGNYAVIVTENGCSDTSSCFSIFGIGIAESNQVKIQIYPNPISGWVYVNGQSQDALTIVVSDLAGRVIFRSGFKDSISIDLSTLQPGSYLAGFYGTNGDILAIQKIVKL